MKKKLRLLAAAGVCAAAVSGVIACGDDSVSQSAAEPDGSVYNEYMEPEKGVSGYIFPCNGIELGADMEMAPIVEALGEPVSYYEEPSCASQGVSKIYTYADFTIETYPDGENDRILSIILRTDNVATAEGIDLSCSKEDVIAAYGEGYEDAVGQMVYRKDGMNLCFITDEDMILSIEYNSSVYD